MYNYLLVNQNKSVIIGLLFGGLNLLTISLRLSFGGALIQRAEIIPFEPDAVSTDEGTRVLNDLKVLFPLFLVANDWLLKRLVHSVLITFSLAK